MTLTSSQSAPSSERSRVSSNFPSEIPIDILLEILSFLPLKSIISARGVHSHWRSLLPKSPILPIRRDLLKMFDEIINSPKFLPSREDTLMNLKSFDRRAYVDAMRKEAAFVPFEFEIWILEWPARVVFKKCWPGFDTAFNMGSNLFAYGSNLLSKRPRIHDIAFHTKTTQKTITISCLKVWYSGCTCDTVLVLECDPEQKHLQGAVFATDSDETNDTDDPDIRLASDWISYQRRLLAEWSATDISGQNSSESLQLMSDSEEDSESEHKSEGSGPDA